MKGFCSALLVLMSFWALAGCGSGGGGQHPMFPLQVVPAGGALAVASQNTSYAAVIAASYGVPPYTFKLDPTSAVLPAGLTFSATGDQGTFSGTPTALGTTTGIVMDVTDSESPAVTIKVPYTIIVVSQTAACRPHPELLPVFYGQYAFLLKGFDSSGNPAQVGGVLTFDGTGLITSGEIDMNLSSGVQTNLPVTGVDGILPDGRGCMAIITPTGTQSYQLSAGAFLAVPLARSAMLRPRLT